MPSFSPTLVVLAVLVALGNPERLHYGNPVLRKSSHLLDSSILIHHPHQHQRQPASSNGEDQFHLKRLERVRYGKAFRPQALPLVAEAPHSDECKYKKEPWQDCDPITKSQTRRLVLKKGNPACEPTKEMTRSCKVKGSAQASAKKVAVCRYKKGTWSDCDNHTGLKTRTDSLKFNRHAQPEQTRVIRESCEPTRVMTRKCKATKLGCKYNRAASWSECDPRTNLRTKVLKLDKALRNANDCEPERRITRNCRLGDKSGRKSSSDVQDEDEEQK
ncbi:uncharacterized protein LOC100903014 [Galendromus occidentalis]|uniref:Uncharacterized protein LOC100903014 n=1 Tax=Galendromus occidentalis TaxID=34638 RepID=A0AAJ6QNK7_9ACAR|nr:uncharacterized protein LOC100903014 [Galendromus occidentalis]